MCKEKTRDKKRSLSLLLREAACFFIVFWACAFATVVQFWAHRDHALRVARYQFGVKGTQLYVSSPRWRVRRSRSIEKINYSQGIWKVCEIFIKGDSKPITICNYFILLLWLGLVMSCRRPLPRDPTYTKFSGSLTAVFGKNIVTNLTGSSLYFTLYYITSLCEMFCTHNPCVQIWISIALIFHSSYHFVIYLSTSNLENKIIQWKSLLHKRIKRLATLKSVKRDRLYPQFLESQLQEWLDPYWLESFTLYHSRCIWIQQPLE